MTHDIKTKEELQELLEFNGFIATPYEDDPFVTQLYSADDKIAVFFEDSASKWGCQVSTFGSDTYGKFQLCTDDVREFAGIIIPRFNLKLFTKEPK